MVDRYRRGDSEFTRLNDGSYTEHDAAAGWVGTSRFQHGLATGRPSPAMPSRVRPVTALMRARPDLVTETDTAGHGHGQLFHPAPFVQPTADVLRAGGVPQRRPSSGEGFLPRLGSVAGETDPARRSAIAADKMETLGQAGKITRPVTVRDPAKPAHLDTNVDIGEPGTSTPMRTQMQNRANFVDPNVEGDWYHVESNQVNDAATRAGVPHGTMRRAVAYTSPKTPWDTGHPQDANVKYPNLNAAEAIVTHVASGRKRAANEGRGFDPVSSALDTRIPTVSGEGERMPAFSRAMRTVGESMVAGTSSADPIVTRIEAKGNKTMTGEKVPNFDLALARGSDSRTARREATQAYTSDVWDTRTAGVNDYSHIAGGGLTPPGGTQRRTGGDKGVVASRPRGQYDVIATTGRRAGMQAGMLPSEMQQHVWRVARGAGSAPEQQMFEHAHGQEFVTRAARPDVERTGPRGFVSKAEHEAWLDKNDEF